MTSCRPRDSEIMSWDPENMEAYWQQCRYYDSRPNDTRSIMGSGLNQIDSQRAFARMLCRLSKNRSDKYVG